MAEKDARTTLFERGDAMQSFWGFYISIAIGIIALMGSSPCSSRPAAVIAMAFICFAFVNCSGIYAIANCVERSLSS